MTSWNDFLMEPINTIEMEKARDYLQTFCSLPEETNAAENAAATANVIAIRLVCEWINLISSVPGCDFTLPFYKSLNRAAVLVVLGTYSGISPDSIGLETLLNDIADFSTGTLTSRIPLSN